MTVKIVCLLDQGFEDSEFQDPYDQFRAAGHEVTVVGFKAGQELKGYRGGVSVATDRGIAEVRPEQFDALFLPGGNSPDHLRASTEMVEFVKAFMAEDKPVLAICHGPQLLLSAGVVGGRRLTAWRTIQGDLRYTDAEVVDEPVVVDRNLVTSRQPDDIPSFVSKSLDLLRTRGATGGQGPVGTPE